MAGFTPAFVRLFLRPRMTMRWVLDDDPNFGVMSISVVSGITAILRSSLMHGFHPLPGLHGIHPQLDAILAYGIGATPEWPLLISAIGIAGGLFGVLGISIGAFVLWLTGLFLGGKGRYHEVRSALAWSFVPYSWLLPLWIMVAILGGGELRTLSFDYASFLPGTDSSTLMWVLFVCDYAMRLFALVWIVLKLSVAHRFSLWKSALNTAVAVAILVYLIPRFHALGF
jgi:Yip1 domain